MPEYTEKQKEDRRKAVRNYEKNNYRLNIVFPKGTKERIESLSLNKTNSAFVRDTVLSKLDELEKILK
jgi:predicted DNA-binding protein